MNHYTQMQLFKSDFLNCEAQNASPSEEEFICKSLSDFEIIKRYDMVVIDQSLTLTRNQNKSYLALINITFTYKGAKSPQAIRTEVEQEIVGFARLKKNYGKVLIRPETIEDKIVELFDHADIDFSEEPDFSKKYYVFASDEVCFRKNVTPSFLQAIAKQDFFEIEILGELLLIKVSQVYTPEVGKAISECILQINNGFH